MPVFPRSIVLIFAALAGLLGLQTLLPELTRREGAPPPAAAPAAVDFVGSGAIEMAPGGAADAAATILVRNDSGAAATAAFEGALLDRLGRPLGTFTQTAPLATSLTSVTLRLTPSPGFAAARDDRLPARGVVVLRATPAAAPGATPTIKSRDLLLPQIQPSSAERSITGLGLIAAAVVLVFGTIVSFSATANPRLEGAPAWTPQSWSTNLAIGGALLTMVLGIAALPAQTHYAARTAYATLSTFFAALVAVAPAVYGLLKVGAPTPARSLRLFAFAAAITVWATVGQLGTTALLFLELGMARVISMPSARAAAMLFAIVAILVFVYALRAVHAYNTGGAPAPGGPAPPPGPAGHWPLL